MVQAVLSIFLTVRKISNIFQIIQKKKKIVIWMFTRILFEEEKSPAHGRDNMIWARGSWRIS